ncbi:MAG: hypothetical protein OXI63_18125 [Candidatus Poribacteria bacterium]|nr:hypothetical protein [Candidatus Poribacteria bacterium]
MKTFASLLLFLLAFFALGCDDTGKPTDNPEELEQVLESEKQKLIRELKDLESQAKRKYSVIITDAKEPIGMIVNGYLLVNLIEDNASMGSGVNPMNMYDPAYFVSVNVKEKEEELLLGVSFTVGRYSAETISFDNLETVSMEIANRFKEFIEVCEDFDLDFNLLDDITTNRQN